MREKADSTAPEGVEAGVVGEPHCDPAEATHLAALTRANKTRFYSFEGALT